MIGKKLILVGLIFILCSIILGAMAAHYIEKLGVSEDGLESFNTGVRYLFYNGLGMLVIASLEKRFDFSLKLHYRSILWGTLLFSASIFALVLLPLAELDVKIYGWFTLLAKYIRTYRSE